MRRRAPEERVDPFHYDQLFAELEPIRRQAARWALDHMDRLAHITVHPPETLHDRAQDLWRPLLAIAELSVATGRIAPDGRPSNWRESNLRTTVWGVNFSPVFHPCLNASRRIVFFLCASPCPIVNFCCIHVASFRRLYSPTQWRT